MRPAFFFLLAIVLPAQPPPPFNSEMGTATSVTRSQITIQTGIGPKIFYATKESKIWRGTENNLLSRVQVGDRVSLRYQPDPRGRPVILDLWANIDHISGRIKTVAGNTFEVDQNYNADPKSAYVRQTRQISFDATTQFESSAAEDLHVGRDVDIIGLKLTGAQVQATRITIYEGNRPIRMRAGAITIAPDGSRH